MQVIPKLEFLFTDSICIGALVVPKKNDQPVIITDVYGGIIGTNRVVIFE